MKALLGPSPILSSIGAISALPGSTNQHLHADYYPLFEEDVDASNKTPTFAITLGVPLIDIDMVNGPTHIWAGSHHTYPIEQSMLTYAKHYLHGEAGSCYFWDYRTFHAGGSNHSEEVRSLLYMAYTRKWFRDCSNPDYLKISEEEYQSIPEEHRSLFAQLENQVLSSKKATLAPCS
jgi:ectoine hydroxylase-related dioxygenase (phytanoyl-CoA dioxygenase family)